MISEKIQHCNLQSKHTFDICLYLCILTYEFCSKCQYKVKSQSDVWQECFYLTEGNLFGILGNLVFYFRFMN